MFTQPFTLVLTWNYVVGISCDTALWNDVAITNTIMLLYIKCVICSVCKHVVFIIYVVVVIHY